VKRRLLSVAIDPLVSSKMQARGSDALPNETGGVLLGYIATTATTTTVHVASCLEIPDPDATHTSYQLDPGRAETAMRDDRAANDPDGEHGYVGDWHTHPANQPASSHDLDTLFRVATGRRYPFAIVVLSWAEPRWLINTHVSTGHWWWRRWR
jgi:integrative and conjugative element protein (TIGR02256 family)